MHGAATMIDTTAPATTHPLIMPIARLTSVDFIRQELGQALRNCFTSSHLIPGRSDHDSALLPSTPSC
ncbi:hypothetical protein NPIL_563601 [Nephila pilipes]|uniref:Uncharacterized protein n=1 Tax=Nephila pilipes TaxID=299642 RepID=A0A8X6TDM5_NEPPI|nr:hypothetical protein NPIL_563601 [Nephila pilipes]